MDELLFPGVKVNGVCAMIGGKRVLLRGYGNVGNGCIFTRCDPGARVVLMSLVVVILSMCSPVEFIVYDSHWSSFAVLCLVHFVGSLVWPHRFRLRISHFKYVHPMRQVAETQKLSAAVGAEVKAFNAYAKWCSDQARDDGHQQETLDASIAPTNAAIEKFAAKAENAIVDISSLTS